MKGGGKGKGATRASPESEDQPQISGTPSNTNIRAAGKLLSEDAAMELGLRVQETVQAHTSASLLKGGGPIVITDFDISRNRGLTGTALPYILVLLCHYQPRVRMFAPSRFPALTIR